MISLRENRLSGTPKKKKKVCLSQDIPILTKTNKVKFLNTRHRWKQILKTFSLAFSINKLKYLGEEPIKDMWTDCAAGQMGHFWIPVVGHAIVSTN